MKTLVYLLFICFSLSFVMKMGNSSLLTKAGKQIEKVMNGGSEEDSNESESDDSGKDPKFGLKDDYVPDDYLHYSVVTPVNLPFESRQYFDVHLAFKSSLPLAIFAPPPNMI